MMNDQNGKLNVCARNLETAPETAETSKHEGETKKNALSLTVGKIFKNLKNKKKTKKTIIDHFQMESEGEKVAVFVRSRPLLGKELEHDSTGCLGFSSERNSLEVDGRRKKRFTVQHRR